MKATGVVRRIDDLGRIVIPKELRRSLRIREGDSVEIYTDGNESVIIKKYSPIDSINSFINQYAEAIYLASKKDVLITDSEKVIAIAGGFKKELLNKKIDIRLDDKMQRKQTQIFEQKESLEITDNLTIKDACIMKPILVYGDVIGSVIIVGNQHIGEIEKTLVDSSAAFISKYLES